MKETKKLRAAAYARVSTASDIQDGSFETQCEHYRSMIDNDSTLEFVGIYGDHGKSGRHVEGRQALQQLLDDAEAGKIDVIYCKSISRLARNMRECLEIIRRLKEKGVVFRFEKENLDTGTMAGEFIFSIMAAIAAEESNSISANMKQARRKALQAGKVWGKPRYGYRLNAEKDWVIYEPEAAHIRELFRLAADETDYRTILSEINALELREQTGRVWSHAMMLHALKSEVYIGDILFNKECVILEKDGHKRRIRNDGQEEQVYIEDHHPAIVDRALFDSVNRLIQAGMLHSAKKRRTENGLEKSK